MRLSWTSELFRPRSCSVICQSEAEADNADRGFTCHFHMQIRDLFIMFMLSSRYGKLSVGFQPIRIRENSTMNNNKKYSIPARAGTRIEY